MLHRAGGREKKEEKGPLAPSSDKRGAGSNGEHEKMHIEPSLADALPRVLRSIPSAAKVSAGVKNQSERVIQAVRRDSKTSQNEATGGKQGESLPFIVLMGEGLVLSRSVFRPFHSDPLPE